MTKELAGLTALGTEYRLGKKLFERLFGFV